MLISINPAIGVPVQRGTGGMDDHHEYLNSEFLLGVCLYDHLSGVGIHRISSGLLEDCDQPATHSADPIQSSCLILCLHQSDQEKQ